MPMGQLKVNGVLGFGNYGQAGATPYGRAIVHSPGYVLVYLFVIMANNNNTFRKIILLY